MFRGLRVLGHFDSGLACSGLRGCIVRKGTKGLGFRGLLSATLCGILEHTEL